MERKKEGWKSEKKKIGNQRRPRTRIKERGCGKGHKRIDVKKRRGRESTSNLHSQLMIHMSPPRCLMYLPSLVRSERTVICCHLDSWERVSERVRVTERGGEKEREEEGERYHLHEALCFHHKIPIG